MSSPGSNGATIRIFLIDGSPHGLRTITHSGWTGSCLAFARSDYSKARQRPELLRTGVYILLGPDAEGHHFHRVYIGEADEVRVRLDAHQKEKDFWTQAFVLTTTDDSLNKAHVRFLEARLLVLARKVNSAALDNGTAPPIARLSEPEVADMDSYLANSLVQLSLGGIGIFDAPAETPPAKSHVVGVLDTAVPGVPDMVLSERSDSPAAPPTGIHYYLQGPGADAEGVDDARGFVVLNGALARAEAKVTIPSYKQLRDRLVAEAVLVPTDNAQLQLIRAYTFESPSAAASVFTGSSKNGRKEWKDAEGRTLGENQARSAT